MNVYLVDSGGSLFGACYARDKDTFKKANILHSFYYMNELTEKVIIPNCKRFMLDSGAFTFSMGNQPQQLDEYVERYIDFIIRNKVDLFFEMDVDGILPLAKIEEIRRTIERKVGKQSIPVWHKERGWKYFQRMCAEYDYVSIGGVAGNPNGKTIEKMFPHFIKEAHRTGTKIHGLGYTSHNGLKKFHFDSVDSSSWTSGARFGGVHKFDGEKVISLPKPRGTRISDYKALAFHNFKEWIKYLEYAERKL